MCPSVSEKSLQINLNTVDDARSLVQNLAYVKKAYDAHKCSSIQLVVNENQVVEIEGTIKGVIGWTRAFLKIVKPEPLGNNVLIHLPHYVPPVPPQSEPAEEHVPRRRMGRRPGWTPPGKSQPLVPADLTGP